MHSRDHVDSEYVSHVGVDRKVSSELTGNKHTHILSIIYYSVVKVVMCSGGGSPDEARLEQTPYPFHTQLIWRYLGIK